MKCIRKLSIVFFFLLHLLTHIQGYSGNMYSVTELSYMKETHHRMYGQNASSGKLKGSFQLTQLKNWHKNQRRYFRKHFISRRVINVHAHYDCSKDLPPDHTCGIGTGAHLRRHQTFPEYRWQQRPSKRLDPYRFQWYSHR